MTSVQNTCDSSENHQNATASPLRSPKFLRISKERHKSMSITKTPTKSRAEETPDSKRSKRNRGHEIDEDDISPTKKTKSDAKGLKRSVSVFRPRIGKVAPSSPKPLLKASTPQLDKTTRSRSNTLQYSVSFSILPSHYRNKSSTPIYKPYEPIIEEHAEWIRETGRPFIAPSVDLERLHNPYSTWYSDYFVGMAHHNFMAIDTEGNPVSVSLMKTESENRLIFRTAAKDDFIVRPTSKNQTLKKIVKSSHPCLQLKSIREVKDEKHIEELEMFQNNDNISKLKIGVLYCAAGQTDENEMIGNREGSADFEDFLKVLGDKIELKGFGGYNGGLDTVNNSTGTHSLYTNWEGFEIMYHVSTMLPHMEGDVQQLEKKRHIGNDIVVLVFQDGTDEKYIPDTITTHFQHILLVVQKDSGCSEGATRYRLQVARKENVNEFGPDLPSPSTFENDEHFRDFLLSKIVNGEKASMECPTFLTKLQRTRSGLLAYYNQSYPKK